MKTEFQLENFIDVNILQEIQDAFASATGFAAITVNYQGKPLIEYSGFSKFCNLIRKKGSCSHLCEKCDSFGGIAAVRSGRPYIYRCHAGLVDFAAPIILQGRHLGSILAGQVLVAEEEWMELDKIVTETTHWREDEEILKAYNEIPVIPFSKVKVGAELIYLMSNYIAEKNFVNIMHRQLHQKNLTLMEEMRTRVELERALKEAELKALQSQLNPHFLFNALNSIGRLLLIEKAPRAQEIVYSLAEMLRYTLRKANQIVTLQDEIFYIEKYLTIQKVRFQSNLQYEIKIPEEFYDTKVPFMMLLPFVENSLMHGISPKEEGGFINITADANDDNLVVIIEDNGVGIDEERLKKIQGKEIREYQEDTEGTGIGINNVDQRLFYHFGINSGVEVFSKEQEGTKVQVTIPLEGLEVKKDV